MNTEDLHNMELVDIVKHLAVAQTETAAQQAKTDVQLAENAAQMAETDARLAETAAQLAKTDAKIDKLAKMYGGVSNNQGKVTEEFYFNSLGDQPTLAGITYDVIEKNVTRRSKGIQDEFDLILINGQSLCLIEVKYKAHKTDLNRLLDKKLPNFEKLFPAYKNLTKIPALATFYIDDDVRDQALAAGVMVLQRKGDVIETLAA